MGNLDDYEPINFNDVKIGDRVLYERAIQIDCRKGFLPTVQRFTIAAQVTKVMATQFIAQAIFEPNQNFRVRKNDGAVIGNQTRTCFYPIGYKVRNYSGDVIRTFEDQTELAMSVMVRNNKVKQIKARFDAADWNTTNMSDDDVELIEKALKIVEES